MTQYGESVSTQQHEVSRSIISRLPVSCTQYLDCVRAREQSVLSINTNDFTVNTTARQLVVF